VPVYTTIKVCEPLPAYCRGSPRRVDKCLDRFRFPLCNRVTLQSASNAGFSDISNPSVAVTWGHQTCDRKSRPNVGSRGDRKCNVLKAPKELATVIGNERSRGPRGYSCWRAWASPSCACWVTGLASTPSSVRVSARAKKPPTEELSRRAPEERIEVARHLATRSSVRLGASSRSGKALPSYVESSAGFEGRRRSDAITEPASSTAMTASDTQIGILYTPASNILAPTNMSTKERPIFK